MIALIAAGAATIFKSPTFWRVSTAMFVADAAARSVARNGGVRESAKKIVHKVSEKTSDIANNTWVASVSSPSRNHVNKTMNELKRGQSETENRAKEAYQHLERRFEDFQNSTNSRLDSVEHGVQSVEYKMDAVLEKLEIQLDEMVREGEVVAE